MPTLALTLLWLCGFGRGEAQVPIYFPLMNRSEALHILGLNEGATQQEIKEAYREAVQIMHPDKFAGNKKLQARATEQFKYLQEAYDVLKSSPGRTAGGRTGAGGRGSSSGGRSSSASASSGTRGAARSYTVEEDGTQVEYLTVEEIKARLAGIAAARAQLVAQKDALEDERRNGVIMAVIGGVATLLTIRRPFGIFGAIAAVASAATVWGVIKIWSSQQSINTLDKHLAELKRERQEYEALLDD